MKLSTSTVRIGVLAAVLVVGVGAIVADKLWLKPQTFANQDELLAKIAEANLAVRNSNNVEKGASPETTGSDAKISSLYFRAPDDRTYNYKITTNSYEAGKAAAICKQMVPYEGDVTKETYSEYYSNKKEAFPKYSNSITYTDEDIYNYFLSSGTEQWQYRGGSYAVHLTNVQQMMPLATMEGIPENVKTLVDPVSNIDGSPVVIAKPEETVTEIAPTEPIVTPVEVTPVPVDPKETIKNYFGENVKILGKQTKNGKDVYKVQWSFEASCDSVQSNPDRTISSSSAVFDKKIIVVAYADAKDFSIQEESYYLDDVASRNLLYTHQLVQTTKNVKDFSEVKDEFTFSIPVEVKTVDASTFNYGAEYQKAVLAYLAKTSDKVASLLGSFKVQSFSSQLVTVIPDEQRHLIDRAFYSSKDYGDKLYQDSKDMFVPYTEMGKTYPFVNVSYEGNKTLNWLSLSLVKGDLSPKEAVATLGADTSLIKETGSIQVIVDGVKKTATLLETERKQSGSSSGNNSETGTTETLPAPDDFENLYKEVYVVINFGGITGVVQTNYLAATKIADIEKQLDFKTTATTDLVQLQKLFPLINSVGNPRVIAY